VCVLFDLDDTLFAERDYFRSVFETFMDEIGDDSVEVQIYLDEFSDVRKNNKDIFSHFLREHGLYTKQNHQLLFDMYRSVSTQLSPHNGVEYLINKLLETQVAIAVLTNGVPEAQNNKWLSLQFEGKESIKFYAARELCGDKPNALTHEAWRTDQQVEWSRVIAVGDKYDNDLAYPLEMGASAVLVHPYPQANQGSHVNFKQAVDFSSAVEHILSLVKQV
jgi:phosphoglycolate phosphatase-like HAD superfamily hydrolase